MHKDAIPNIYHRENSTHTHKKKKRVVQLPFVILFFQIWCPDLGCGTSTSSISNLALEMSSIWAQQIGEYQTYSNVELYLFSLSVPHLQFLVFFLHRCMSSTHPPSSLGICQPSSTDLLLKETQCPHWPPLVPVVSSSSVRFQCCVAASDVEGKQNLGTKAATGRHEGRGWLGIHFC